MRKRLPKSRLVRSAAVASVMEHLEYRTLFAVAQPANPGFEVPVVGSGKTAYVYNPTGASWTFSGASGISGNNSDFTSGNPNAPEGSQVAFLQVAGSTISQSVDFTAGTYAVGFEAAQRIIYQYGGQQNFEVLVDGNVVGTFQPTAGGAYGSYETNAFTVTGGAHTITFEGLDTHGGDNTAFIDAVHVDSVVAGVPADASFETPSVGTGSSAFEYNPTGTPWTFNFSNNQYGSGVAGNGSGFTAANAPAPDGTQVGFLERNGASISQAVSLPAGSYALSFDAAQRVNYQASQQDFEVLVDGNVVGTFTPVGGGQYQAYQTNAFTVTGSGSHTIQFLGLDSAGGDNTAFVDSVKVLNETPVPPPPPPPSTTLTVGPGQEFSTIQAAIDASSSGDTINVYSGTYTEQDTIPLGLDNLTVEAAPGQIVTIQAPTTIVAPGAIFRIQGQNDTLQGFTITGPGATAGQLVYGVLVDFGGSATIQNNHVTKIEDATFGSSKTGYGIAVIDGSANIFNNIVDNYQKAGIDIGLPPEITGSATWLQSGDVENNTVTGAGPTSLITQNGIQFVGVNATGTAKTNHVTGNTFTGPIVTGNAVGILLYNAGNSITVMNNIAYSNDTNIKVDGGLDASQTPLHKSNFAVVSGNTVYQASYYDGIDLVNGTSNDQVTGNYSYNNPFDGIFIDQFTGGNTISNNIFTNNHEVDVNDQTYSASNFQGAPQYGTFNFYSGNTLQSTNGPLIPSA